MSEPPASIRAAAASAQAGAATGAVARGGNGAAPERLSLGDRPS